MKSASWVLFTLNKILGKILYCDFFPIISVIRKWWKWKLNSLKTSSHHATYLTRFSLSPVPLQVAHSVLKSSALGFFCNTDCLCLLSLGTLSCHTRDKTNIKQNKDIKKTEIILSKKVSQSLDCKECLTYSNLMFFFIRNEASFSSSSPLKKEKEKQNLQKYLMFN